MRSVWRFARGSSSLIFQGGAHNSGGAALASYWMSCHSKLWAGVFLGSWSFAASIHPMVCARPQLVAGARDEAAAR
eukprot:5045796-Pyramimonas_sp.AAC.1